jgi:hypothetical protein
MSQFSNDDLPDEDDAGVDLGEEIDWDTWEASDDWEAFETWTVAAPLPPADGIDRSNLPF